MARQPVDEALFTTEPYIVRRQEPVLTYRDCPYPAALTFNAGVVKQNGEYVMLFRNDYGDYEKQRLEGTHIGLARSTDGFHFTVDPNVRFSMHENDIWRVYDPRITYIDGKTIVCCAVDTHHGIRGGIALTEDFKHYEMISLSAPDNRNMVLFPEKIGGEYVRLERPMPVYSRGGDRFDMWISYSKDLVYWGKSELVLATEDLPYCNDKLGPGAPPLKTDDGWLVLFHSVDRDDTRGKNGWENTWQKRYSIGVALLDLENPAKVIGYSEKPILVPESYDEVTEGFRTNVLFPCGAILEDDGKTVRIYYGASDTVVKVATAPLDALIASCTKKKK